jgi:long-chain acyl-CoA synthetase
MSSFFKPTDIFGKVGSVEVGDPPAAGESRPRRLGICADALVTRPWEGINTTTDVLAYTAQVYGDKRAVGWREIEDEIEEEKEVTKTVDGKSVVEKKKWKYFKLGKYQYLTFNEVKEAVSEVSRGLAELGVEKGDVFNVYASTR